MKLMIVVDVTRDRGANYSAANVADVIVEEIEGSLGRFVFMGDETDTRYIVNGVSALP